MLGASRIAATLVVLALVISGCSSDDGDASTATTTAVADDETTSSTVGTASPADRPPPSPAAVEVTGPVQGVPQTTSTAGMDAHGYVEQEFFVSGTASSYTAADALTDDGRWSVVEDGSAPFTTRVLVRRPADPTEASGVFVIEWNNVSSGFDATPDWGWASTELMREGHVYVGVSAQSGGIEGDGGGLASGFGQPLKAADPSRYEPLAHPGDVYSYDIFARIGALAAAGPADGIDPFADLPRDHVIGAGESQSAFRLTTYINGIHPIAPVFDGFLVHSRGGGAAPLSADASVGSSIVGAVHIREDVDVPVFIFSTETDLTVLGYAGARQRDSEQIRSWEVAGTAHVDAFLLGGDAVALGNALGCAEPVNSGPQHVALKAAVRHLVAWVVDGTPPPGGEPISMTDDGTIIDRDADGNALGGIRLAQVRVPSATLSGEGGSGSRLCGLFGTTVPFAPADLVERYGSSVAYAQQVGAAFTEDVDAGFALDADRDAALTFARTADFG